MAIQILPRYPSAGENIGTAIGTGLSNLLQGLVQNRVQQLHQRQTAQGLQGGYNFSPEEAQALSLLSPEIMKYAVQQKSQQPMYQQEAQTLQALLQLMGQQPQGGTGLDALTNLGQGSLRPGQALPIANFLQSQQQHQQNLGQQQQQFAQKQKEFEIGKLQPRFNELQNQYADITNQIETYNRLSDLNKQQMSGGLLGFGKNEASQEFESLLEGLVPFGATEAQLESARKKLPTLKQNPNVRQKLIDYNLNNLQQHLKRIQRQAQSLDYGNLNLPGETVNPDSPEVFETILNNAQGAPLDKLRAATTPTNKSAMANQLSQEQSDLSRVAQGAAYLGKKAAQGAIGGLTGIVTAPFSLANFLTLGNIPVPEVIQQIQDLPEQTMETLAGQIQPGSETEQWLGDFVEDLASFLVPGGALGKLGQATKLSKLNTVAKILGTSPKAAATVAAAGNLAKLATEKLGGTEREGNIVKAGAMLLTPMIGSRFAHRQISNLAKDAVNAAKDDVIKSPGLLNANIKFYEALTKGVETPLKNQVMKDINLLFHPTEPAQMKLKDVLNAKASVLQAAENKDFAKSMKNSLPIYNQELDKVLEKAGKINPKFGVPFDELKDLSDAVKTTNVVTDFAKKHLGANRYRSPLTYAILGLAAKELTGLPYYKALGAIGIPAWTLGESHRVLKMALQSPAFRKYYGDYITFAARGNVKMAEAAADKLDKIINHEEKNLE